MQRQLVRRSDPLRQDLLDRPFVNRFLRNDRWTIGSVGLQEQVDSLEVECLPKDVGRTPIHGMLLIQEIGNRPG